MLTSWMTIKERNRVKKGSLMARTSPMERSQVRGEVRPTLIFQPRSLDHDVCCT